MVLVREFCAENMTLVPAAIRAGARRIELCDNLAVGGTSPSFGVLRAAVSYAFDHDVDVMAMCRPRGGDFVYDARERAMLCDDIRCARAVGATGVVFGCVRQSTGDVRPMLDLELAKRLVDEAKGLGRGDARGTRTVQVTFHMAFDELGEQDCLAAIDELASLGVERILTHGGKAGTPIEQNLDRLAELVSYAAGRITMLPGGGITWQNAELVAARLGVREVHGTKVVRLEPTER